MSKIATFEEAVKLIKDGDLIAMTGLISFLCPEKFLSELEKRFLDEKHPRELELFTPCRVGWAPGKGMEHFAHQGLLKRWISSSFSSDDSPVLDEMIKKNQLEVYSYSMGVMYQWLRAIAAKLPGLISEVGLGTYVDPRLDAGQITSCCQKKMVKIIEIEGKEFIHYQPLSVDVAIIMGTTADEIGNISMEHEPVTLGVLSAAQAAKANGGIVIAQVKRVVKRDSIPTRKVVVPGVLVDAIVVDPQQRQSLADYNPYWTGEVKKTLSEIKKIIPMNIRKVILRRAAMELEPGDIVNLGVGIPVNLPFLALEENFIDMVTFSTEHGAVGGIPSGVEVFGSHINPEAIISAPDNFSMYHGGCLDISYLGFAEIDKIGNVNVSRFGSKLRGSGGFIDIISRTKKLVFCGTLTAGGLETELNNGKLRIIKEGKNRKFIPQVQHITFSGSKAIEKDQDVFYVTERAVFQLKKEGLVLIEVAPGIDIESDILSKIGFSIRKAENIRTMDCKLFKPDLVGFAKIISNKVK